MERSICNFLTRLSSRRLCSATKTLHNDLKFRNPCVDLEKYLEIPVFEKNELSFTPTIKAMEIAEDFFVPKPGHKIQHISSAIDPEKFPNHNLPEVAFIGRSNVGKSSVLKALFKHEPEVRIKTSKTPGHTKSVQFFKIGSKLCLVDMPGYGYREPKWFLSSVGGYFRVRRKNLVKAFVLIDGEVGLQFSDEGTLRDLEELKIPYALIMTKIDKACDSLRLRNLLHLQNIRNQVASVCCFQSPFMISCHTNEGLAYLQAFILHITGNLNVEEE